MTKNEKTFEENLLELENIVKELEAGNVDLEWSHATSQNLWW